MESFSALFPLTDAVARISEHLKAAQPAVAALEGGGGHSRLCGPRISDEHVLHELAARFGRTPIDGLDANDVISELVSAFAPGAVNWRSPLHFYNVGAPVTSVATAVSAIFSDFNVFNIDDTHGGNAILAERCVLDCLSHLVGLAADEMGGLFTFGGTATNLYAMKVATRAHLSESSTKGIHADVVVLVTESAHYCHALAADWLGLGTAAVVTMAAGDAGRTDVTLAAQTYDEQLQLGRTVVGAMLNGGTTYEHTIDDIRALRAAFDAVAKRHGVKRPMIHVDAVIGWTWLWFTDYDFVANPLDLSVTALDSIADQLHLIKGLDVADTWGVDFHKGVGACPVASSLFIVNDGRQLAMLSKSDNPATDDHHLGRDFACFAPTQYTLETSRSAGAAVCALAAMRVLGVSGFQRWLGQLVEASVLLRDLLRCTGNFDVYPDVHGYVTIAVAIPPNDTAEGYEARNAFTEAFYAWFGQTEPEFLIACSKSFRRRGRRHKEVVLKFYPTSPHLGEAGIRSLVTRLNAAKQTLDASWTKRPCIEP